MQLHGETTNEDVETSSSIESLQVERSERVSIWGGSAIGLAMNTPGNRITVSPRSPYHGKRHRITCVVGPSRIPRSRHHRPCKRQKFLVVGLAVTWNDHHEKRCEEPRLLMTMRSNRKVPMSHFEAREPNVHGRWWEQILSGCPSKLDE